MHISDFRAFERNTLRGFFTLTLPSGLVIHDCSLHQKNGSCWIGLPSQKFTGRDGKVGYKPMIEFTDKAISYNFRDQVLKALDREGHAVRT